MPRKDRAVSTFKLRFFLGAFALLGGSAASAPPVSLDDVLRSHIEGNVPPQAQFREYLHRDLLTHFRRAGAQNVSDVTYELLREGPTQTGISYPKYYMWVRLIVGGKTREEGAARVAAVDRTHFEVTDFLSRDAIRANPDSVRSVFPAPLVDKILAKVGH